MVYSRPTFHGKVGYMHSWLCWAEPNRAPCITQDHPEVHQQRYHLKYGKYKPRVAGLPAKGTFGSLRPQLFGDCWSGHYKTRRPVQTGLFSVPIRTPRPARPKCNQAPPINTRPLATPRPVCSRGGSVGRAASSTAAAGRAVGRRSHRDRRGSGFRRSRLGPATHLPANRAFRLYQTKQREAATKREASGVNRKPRGQRSLRRREAFSESGRLEVVKAQRATPQVRARGATTTGRRSRTTAHGEIYGSDRGSGKLQGAGSSRSGKLQAESPEGNG